VRASVRVNAPAAVTMPTTTARTAYVIRSPWKKDSTRALFQVPAGSRVVTILCDGGDRYRSRLYNREWLAENDCLPTHTDLSFL